MNIEVKTYKNPVIVEGEIEKLHKLRSLLIKDDDEINQLTTTQKGKKRSGIYSSIVLDIRAFYELDQSLTASWVLKDKFKGRDRKKIKQLLLNRIDAVNCELMHFPESLFTYQTSRVPYKNRIVDVVEISRKNWDYILYKSINYDDEYFASVVFSQSAADYSKILKLSPSEVEIAKRNRKEEIEEMINNMRESNR